MNTATLNTVWVLASEAPNGKIFPGDVKEFWWGAAASVIVFGLMAWKLSPMISTVLAKRGDTVRDELAAADAAQAAADAEIAALRARLGDADADAARIVGDATAAADRLRSDSIAAADADAVDLRARATADIEATRSHASADLQAEVSTKALQVAEEIVRANLDDETQRRLIDQYIDQVGASS